MMNIQHDTDLEEGEGAPRLMSEYRSSNSKSCVRTLAALSPFMVAASLLILVCFVVFARPGPITVKIDDTGKYSTSNLPQIAPVALPSASVIGNEPQGSSIMVALFPEETRPLHRMRVQATITNAEIRKVNFRVQNPGLRAKYSALAADITYPWPPKPAAKVAMTESTAWWWKDKFPSCKFPY